MKLRRFSISGLPGVPEGDWDFARPDVVVVSGAPASGKSRWLGALAAHKESVAAYGSTAWIRELIGGAPTVTTAEWELSPIEQRFGAMPAAVMRSEVQHATSVATADPGLVALFDRYEPDQPLGRVLGIPAHRLPLRSAPSLGDARFAERILALAPDGAKLGASLATLRRSVRERGSLAASVDGLLAASGAGLALRGVNVAGELEVHVGGGDVAGVTRLAASQQQLLLLCAHFCATRPKGSVVLFDAPEEDVPAERAAAFVRAAREAEPTNQWIIATSARSAFDLAGATHVELRGRAS